MNEIMTPSAPLAGPASARHSREGLSEQKTGKLVTAVNVILGSCCPTTEKMREALQNTARQAASNPALDAAWAMDQGAR